MSPSSEPSMIFMLSSLFLPSLTIAQDVYYATWSTIQRPGSFKFFNLLIRNKDFLSMIQRGWQSTHPYGTHMYRICKRLTALKNPLSPWISQHIVIFMIGYLQLGKDYWIFRISSFPLHLPSWLNLKKIRLQFLLICLMWKTHSQSRNQGSHGSRRVTKILDFSTSMFILDKLERKSLLLFVQMEQQ